MPFDRKLDSRPDRPLRLFEASSRSRSQQDMLERLAARDDLVAVALRFEGMLEPVSIREDF